MEVKYIYYLFYVVIVKKNGPVVYNNDGKRIIACAMDR